ncbi:C-type lectin domain family 2 member B [Eptesicus fuscus]|uniref:C-type lectin domain family 2 member B n=1 Tax=Eptesicus fuscus TaxID=29078 RepID=UPI0024041026|nr:C-type lectin domain family 2 member B [Eptesicus fuscus]
MEDMVKNIASSALQKGVPGTDSKKQGVNKYKVSTIGLLVIIFLSICVIASQWPRSTQYCCPDGWIGFQKNCYYFSEQEMDWNSSRKQCFTQHADLTVIDTREEMDFLRQHKSIYDLWIGLEMTENQKGKWINGGMFNKWFDVRGNEKCAYLSDDGVATARCYTIRKWICRKKKVLQKNISDYGL